VIVGGRAEFGLSGQKRLDEFNTPFSGWLQTRQYTPGAEIHATALLNLLHHDWLHRASLASESAFVIILGLVLGALRWLRPWRALALTAAALLFTDLEGFTTLSEKLGDSARLGQVLTDYFTRTTDQILAENGTVIKFIGDAVYAAWRAAPGRIMKRFGVSECAPNAFGLS
jgi:hypothetical protein